MALTTLDDPGLNGYYTHKYSGEEIDKLLSGIPPGGAADKSVQDIVEATSVPSRTVEVAAADLHGYISKLPRLLTEHLTISVIGTAELDALTVMSLYGPGSLTIRIAENAEVTVQIQVRIDTCAVPITLEGLKIIGKASPGGSICFVLYSPLVAIRNCMIDREHDLGASGVGATNGSNILLDRCQITNCNMGINVMSGGILVASNCTARNNKIGISVSGGIVMLAGTTPELLGGSANNKVGGIIVKSNGTLQ